MVDSGFTSQISEPTVNSVSGERYFNATEAVSSFVMLAREICSVSALL